MILTRSQGTSEGVFGRLETKTGDSWYTLERSYASEQGFEAKVPVGIYVCQRGIHTLLGKEPMELFEITHVPGHLGILFHMGNYNRDSEGCVLLGEDVLCGVWGKMLIKSDLALDRFMGYLKGLDSFTLRIMGGT